MLVHVSTRVRDQGILRSDIVQLFDESGYATGGPGLARLRMLWKEDFCPICKHARFGDLPVPASFAELAPFIGDCVSRIAAGGDCALVLRNL